ncbi:hypothetical protein [Ruegeria lacuscaerulensis]|uniref:hypothetical protein n=1 Tax=Ruegeria lacuscaerulensis TaxID=55218 RepID=UPI00147D11DB|nr:hypothetical protein [Ruegeria lacuscaerulensis]
MNRPGAAQPPFNAVVAGLRGLLLTFFAVFESPAFIPGFEDLAVVCNLNDAPGFIPT